VCRFQSVLVSFYGSVGYYRWWQVTLLTYYPWYRGIGILPTNTRWNRVGFVVALSDGSSRSVSGERHQQRHSTMHIAGQTDLGNCLALCASQVMTKGNRRSSVSVPRWNQLQ
jgi:hypothetical protein